MKGQSNCKNGVAKILTALKDKFISKCDYKNIKLERLSIASKRAKCYNSSGGELD